MAQTGQNGASWVEVADMSTARTQLAGSGVTTSALASTGTTGSLTTATEEWNNPSTVVKTLTD